MTSQPRGFKSAQNAQPDTDAKIEKKLYKDLAYLTQLSVESKDLQRIHNLQRKIVRETIALIADQVAAELDKAIKELARLEALLQTHTNTTLNQILEELPKPENTTSSWVFDKVGRPDYLDSKDRAKGFNDCLTQVTQIIKDKLGEK